MDLGSQLQLLTGSRSTLNSENRLAGYNEDDFNEDSQIEEFNSDPLSIDNYLQETGYSNGKKSKKSPKKSSSLSLFDSEEDEDDEPIQLPKDLTKLADKKALKAIRDTQNFIKRSKLLDADEFDEYLDDDENGINIEENVEMKNSLISMGRKYARESAESKESSEITKTFADSDKRLKALFEEVSRDKDSIQKDIDRMRVPGRGGKLLSDMLSAKKGMHDTQLQIIKEINSMKKTSFELRAKEAARKEAAAASGSQDINTNTLQSIFNSTKSGLINNIGGYSKVSGALTENEDDDDNYTYDIVDDDMDDEKIQKRYFRSNDENDTETDGDKFLKYEDRGVVYVLEVDDENNVQNIYAEDRDGMRIFDYPMPNNIEDLKFEIDTITMQASDSLHRNYKVRRV